VSRGLDLGRRLHPHPWSPFLLFTAPDNHRSAGAQRTIGPAPGPRGAGPPARPRPAHDSGTSATPTRVDRRRRGRVPACWCPPSRRPHRASARRSPPRCRRRSCLLARRTPRDFPCRAVAPNMEWIAARPPRSAANQVRGKQCVQPAKDPPERVVRQTPTWPRFIGCTPSM
jgi:hypothetical protein